MYVYLLEITKQRCCIDIEWFVSRLYNYVHFPCTHYTIDKDIDVHVYGTCMYIYTCTGHCVCTLVQWLSRWIKATMSGLLSDVL